MLFFYLLENVLELRSDLEQDHLLIAQETMTLLYLNLFPAGTEYIEVLKIIPGQKLLIYLLLEHSFLIYHLIILTSLLILSILYRGHFISLRETNAMQKNLTKTLSNLILSSRFKSIFDYILISFFYIIFN